MHTFYAKEYNARPIYTMGTLKEHYKGMSLVELGEMATLRDAASEKVTLHPLYPVQDSVKFSR